MRRRARSSAQGSSSILATFQSAVASRTSSVLDTSKEAPLFHQNGLSIALPSTVLAAVSVKTACTAKELRDSCATLNSLLDVTNRAANPKVVWLGAFFYEEPKRSPAERFVRDDLAPAVAAAPLPAANVATGFQPPPLGASCFATAGDLFAKVAYSESEATLSAYRANGLAAALFLAHFIDHVATRLGAAEADLIGFADDTSASMIGNPQMVPLGRMPRTRRTKLGRQASALTAVGPPKAKTKKA